MPVVILVAVACAPQNAKPERFCTPGNYVFCRCKDRSEGTKLCRDDGLGFEPCEGCLGGSDNGPGDLEPDPDPYEPPPPQDAAASEAGTTPASGTRPKPGELKVTEVMYDPSGSEPAEEWIEIVNVANAPRILNGLTIRDGGKRTHVVPLTPPAVVVAPNVHVVLVRNRAAAVATGVPMASIGYEYGAGVPDTAGLLLSNGTNGAVTILDGGTEIVSVPYGGWFAQAPPGGSSIQLRALDDAQAKVAAGWCLATLPWGGQPATKTPKDNGTPGAPSVCP